MKKYALNMNHQIKILQEGTKLSVDTMIVHHKVTIFDMGEPIYAVSIENKAIFEIHRELFEILWHSLPG